MTFTGAGAVTIICTVAAGAGPPAGGTYTISGTTTAGVPRMARTSAPEESDDDDDESGLQVGFDPAAHTVDEVKAYADEHPDDISDLLEAEIAGKDRSSLVSYLEDLVPYDPADYTVDEVVEYAETYPDQLDELISAEQAGKNRTTLISQLEDLRV